MLLLIWSIEEGERQYNYHVMFSYMKIQKNGFFLREKKISIKAKATLRVIKKLP